MATMQKNAHHYDDIEFERRPSFATEAEHALAERLRQKIEERYLKAGNTPTETGPSGPFEDRNSTLRVETLRH